MTKQQTLQMDAIGKVWPTKMMMVCETGTVCISLDVINQQLGTKGKLLEINPNCLIEGMIPELNYVIDNDGKTWVTVEATADLVKRQKGLFNKGLILEYLGTFVKEAKFWGEVAESRKE